MFSKFEMDKIPVIPMSTLSEEGIMKVKTEACNRLLAVRVETKAKGRKVNEVMNRLHVAFPTQRDTKVSCQNVLDVYYALSHVSKSDIFCSTSLYPNCLPWLGWTNEK